MDDFGGARYRCALESYTFCGVWQDGLEDRSHRQICKQRLSFGDVRAMSFAYSSPDIVSRVPPVLLARPDLRPLWTKSSSGEVSREAVTRVHVIVLIRVSFLH